MVTKKEETIQIWPMQYLARFSFLVTIYFSQLVAFAQIAKSVADNSTLSCMQGVWKPLNSSNEKLSEYIVYDSFKAVSISYYQKELERIFLTLNGFYDFKNEIQPDSLQISSLKSNGSHFIWFFLEDVRITGWAQLGGIQRDFICQDDVIEMSDNAMTILEKQSFLPYKAYYHIKQQGKKDDRDYVSEFNLVKKLKRAKIVVNKAHFHDDRDASTKRRAFVIEGDEVILNTITNSWIEAAFEGSQTTTEGWLKRTEITILE